MESLKGLANARYQCWRTVVCPEKILAMKLGLALPMVGPAVSSAAGLSAFCRGLEDLGYDTLWVGDRLVTPVAMHSTYPGKEQPYPPQMTRYLDPVLLWTVATTATSRVRPNASGAPQDSPYRPERPVRKAPTGQHRASRNMQMRLRVLALGAVGYASW